jgi:HK97 family phage major capsid protein
MSFTKIKNDIEKLSQKKFEIAGKAEAEGREMSPKEEIAFSELEGAIVALRKELERPSEPQTVIKNKTLLNSTTGPFASFGEFCQSIAAAARPGARVDERLYSIRAAATGLGETISSDGGFLVQQDFRNDLLNAMMETSLLANRCMQIQISGGSNSLKLNCFDETSRASTRFGGIQAFWIDEAQLKTASKPKFRQIELSPKKLIGVCYATDELLSDATALDGVLRRAFASEFGFQLDNVILNGSGAGQPLGILQSGALVTVAAQAGQHLTVVAENIFDQWSRLLPGSESSAIWVCNKNVLPSLYTMSVAVGTGGVPVFMPANQIAGQPYQTLLGRPLLSCEQCATLGTTGDIILADFQNGYVLAQKGGIQSDMSIHVQFLYDESVFRFVLRVDGQPVRASSLVPYKGGAESSQSHFVALATRSA